MFLKQELPSRSEFSRDEKENRLSIVEQTLITIQIYIINLKCIMYYKYF